MYTNKLYMKIVKYFRNSMHTGQGSSGRSSGKDRGLSTPIGLFSTRSGIRTVGSPVRVKILTVLRTGELSFDEIVALSDKAKSTVSVHLKGMIDEGIIGSRSDPEDSRKKIFFIDSRFLGDLSQGLEPEKDTTGNPEDGLMGARDPFGFYRYMFRTIRVSLLSEGINIDPLLHNAGFKVGMQVYPGIADPDFELFLGRLDNFWSRNNLGRIDIESTAPVILKVYDCFECGDLPNLGRPACAFDAGMLRALFSRQLGQGQQVEETACYAMGNDHCRFIISPV
jgi:predicted hydrocarbon binding protein/DNA-binding transcriptional ArsR family regulator